MSSKKELKARMVQKHDLTENWRKSILIPEEGEIIIYDDAPEKIKIGDGRTIVSKLPFLTSSKEVAVQSEAPEDSHILIWIDNKEDQTKIKYKDTDGQWCEISNGSGVGKMIPPNGGEIFNDYEHNTATGLMSHAEGYTTAAAGDYSHAEGCNRYVAGKYSHAEGLSLKDDTKKSINIISSTFNSDNKIATIKVSLKPATTHIKRETSPEVCEDFFLVRDRFFETGFIFNQHEYIVQSYTPHWIPFKSYTNNNIEFTINLTGPEELPTGPIEVSLLPYGAYGSEFSLYGDGNHAEGIDTLAKGEGSHAEGYMSKVIEGYDSEITGAHAEGRLTFACAIGSHSEGCTTQTFGTYSHAEGLLTSAHGSASHAEGGETQAIGIYSHAEGMLTDSEGRYSHAEGYRNQAIGESSHAEGSYNLALKEHSHVEGCRNSAQGESSHAEGSNRYAVGKCSHVEGSSSKDDTKKSINIISSTFDSENKIATIKVLLKPGTTKIKRETWTPPGSYEIFLLFEDRLFETGFLFNRHEYIVQNYTPHWMLPQDYTEDDIEFTINLTGPEELPTGPIEVSLLPYGAYGSDLHAEGMNTLAKGEGSHAEGYMSKVIEGYDSEITGAHAEGVNTQARAAGSHVEGRDTKTFGNNSHAEGSLTKAIGDSSHAEGILTNSEGRYSHTEGRRNQATTECSHAEGDENIASGESSHAEGRLNTASGLASHAEGQEGEASGTFSHVEGLCCRSSFSFAHAEGYSTYSNGLSTHTEGDHNQAEMTSSHAEGSQTRAIGMRAHTEGYYTLAHPGDNSHAEGYYTTAGYANSHAEGKRTIAQGENSHAEGGSNNFYELKTEFLPKKITQSFSSTSILCKDIPIHLFDDKYSREWGGRSEAVPGGISDNYFVMSRYTVLLGGISWNGQVVFDHYNLVNPQDKMYKFECSKYDPISKKERVYFYIKIKDNKIILQSVEGDNLSDVPGLQPNSEGFTTISILIPEVISIHGSLSYGANSHAEGESTCALGKNSHAEGSQTVTTGECSHVEGKNNLTDKEEKYAHIVGNGTDNEHRSNAHTVDWDGNAWYVGHIYSGGTSQDDPQSMDLVAEILALKEEIAKLKASQA